MMSVSAALPVHHATLLRAPAGDAASTVTPAKADAAPNQADSNKPDSREAAAVAAEVAALASTDRKVRSHEAAHLAAAGGLAQGGASFSTVRGPDGQMYAVGGEVGIDVSPAARRTRPLPRRSRSSALRWPRPTPRRRTTGSRRWPPN